MKKMITKNNIRTHFQFAYIMCPPVYCSNDEKINVYMEKFNEPINAFKITQQWLEVYKFIASQSVVFLLPPPPHVQDAVYVSNQGIFVPNTNIFVLSNFRTKVRSLEESHMRNFVSNLGFNIVQSPFYFEGEADLKFQRDNIYYSAWGLRTEYKFSRWFAESFDAYVIPIQIKDEHLYHLDCVVNPIDSNNVLCSIPYLSKEEIKAIEKVANIVPIEKEYDCVMGSCNIVNVNNAAVINQIYRKNEDEFLRIKRLEKLINRCGYPLKTFEFSEFEKSGAAVSCTVLKIKYTNYLLPIT